MRTPEQYKESLRRMRPNVHKFGELIKYVTTHPATRSTVGGHAQLYKASLEPETQDIFTKVSGFSGDRISRYLSLIESADDMLANSRMKRAAFNLTGTCTGGRCVGWNSINAMWATTFDMDAALKTDYHGRLKDWLLKKQKEDTTLCGALTDAKGDRGLSACEQPDPDSSLHVVRQRDDGIRGQGTAFGSRSFANQGEFPVPRDQSTTCNIQLSTRHPAPAFDRADRRDVSCG